ncbi:MAG TPA: glucosamine-6-phosphate deaminase [Pseudolysinimonas sp.]
MEIVILPTAEEVGRLAAARIVHLVSAKPHATLGLATGSSPIAIYTELAVWRKRGIDFSQISAFALDEYVGLPPSHSQSYATVIQEEVVEPLGLDPQRVHVPDGLAQDLDAAGNAYETAIAAAGGIELQILGIGTNGHIGFNEPTSSFQSRTRVKTLSGRTREDNARFFPSLAEVPTHCITQGLGTILDAGELLLVAQGERKAEAVLAAVEGPLTSKVPASILQWHRRATVILDEAAASKLQLADYYRYTYANKPLDETSSLF